MSFLSTTLSAARTRFRPIILQRQKCQRPCRLYMTSYAAASAPLKSVLIPPRINSRARFPETQEGKRALEYNISLCEDVFDWNPPLRTVWHERYGTPSSRVNLPQTKEEEYRMREEQKRKADEATVAFLNCVEKIEKKRESDKEKIILPGGSDRQITDDVGGKNIKYILKESE